MSAPAPSPARLLGGPHFAHLRGVLQGVDLVASARRYLGAVTADDAREAHADVVAAARGLATRQHKALFRHGDLAELFDIASPPAVIERDLVIDRWAATKGIDVEDWSRDELIAAFETENERSAADVAGELAAQGARARLAHQLRTLQALQDAIDVVAQPHHLVSEWFDAKTSGRLLRAGVLRLDELHGRIAADATWFKSVEAIGAGKAAAIRAYLALIMPDAPAPPASPDKRAFAVIDELLGVVASAGPAGGPLTADRTPVQIPVEPPPGGAPAPREKVPAPFPALPSIDVPHSIVAAAEAAVPSAVRESLESLGLDGRHGRNRKPWQPGDLPARTDVEAIVTWLRAKVGDKALDNHAPETARLYEQQAFRLMLWCVSVRRIALSSMQSDDCEAYMAWLKDIPPEWISRSRARRWDTAAGWAPFASQLNRASRQLAIRIVSSMFTWLVDEGYLLHQPWGRVKLKLPDDPNGPARRTRAFTQVAWDAIVEFFERAPVISPELTPARQAELRADWERMRFVLNFNVAVGLRGTELVTRHLHDFVYVDGRWRLAVFGKGALAKDVSLPAQAMRALDRYLTSRGLPPLTELSKQARKDVPLIARADSRPGPIGYRALALSFKGWVQRAMDASMLPMPEREAAIQATTHWLRHTMATIANERGASEPVLQEQLRHADPRTTRSYIHARASRVRDELDRAFA
jgi:integrase